MVWLLAKADRYAQREGGRFDLLAQLARVLRWALVVGLGLFGCGPGRDGL